MPGDRRLKASPRLEGLSVLGLSAGRHQRLALEGSWSLPGSGLIRAGWTVLPCCFMDGANAGPAEMRIRMVLLRWRGVGPHRPLPGLLVLMPTD